MISHSTVFSSGLIRICSQGHAIPPTQHDQVTDAACISGVHGGMSVHASLWFLLPLIACWHSRCCAKASICVATMSQGEAVSII